jgi:hypothetical protein
VITPFDRLIYTSAKLQDVHVVYKHFMRLLQTTQMDTYVWTCWDRAPVSTLPAEPAELWRLGQNFCICTPHGIVPGMHRPCIADGAEGVFCDMPIINEPWDLDALLVFKRSDTSFDVIPLMHNTSPVADNAVFPELQLRYVYTEGCWAYCQSPTGFVNTYAYGQVLDELPPACTRRVQCALDWLGAYILSYLGTYNAVLMQDGAWERCEPKPPRYKTKNGKVKKIYTIAQAGYKQYVQEVP